MSLQTSLILVPSSLWQLQASTTLLVLALCIFLRLVHSQLAFIQSLLNNFPFQLLLSHGRCFFKKSAHSPKQSSSVLCQIHPFKVITTADPCKRLRIKMLLSEELCSEIDLFLAFIHYQEYILYSNNACFFPYLEFPGTP